jgi:hypothetical protein
LWAYCAGCRGHPSRWAWGLILSIAWLRR